MGRGSNVGDLDWPLTLRELKRLRSGKWDAYKVPIFSMVFLLMLPAGVLAKLNQELSIFVPGDLLSVTHFVLGQSMKPRGKSDTLWE